MSKKSRPLIFIPESKNFSSFTKKDREENGVEGNLNYDVSDKGQEVEQVFSGLDADRLILNLLMQLDDRGKIILLYQIMKEQGYGLTQDDYAKTLNFSRVYYSSLVKDVRSRCFKIVKALSR